MNSKLRLAPLETPVKEISSESSLIYSLFSIGGVSEEVIVKTSVVFG